MLDDETPHVAVAAQAVVAQASLPVEEATRRGESFTSFEDRPRVHPIATTLSDEEGKYRFINLKPGPYQVRCQILNGLTFFIFLYDPGIIGVEEP